MYIGKSPQLQGAYDKADSFHATFNSALTAFDIEVSGVAKSIAKATNLMVSFYDLGNTTRYIMEPDVDYTVSGSVITFTVAPDSGDTCWIMIFGDVFSIAVLGSVDDHADVDTTTAAPSTGDLLEWNGTNWIPITLVADDLDDMDTTTAAPSTGDLLEWNGTNWVPITFGADDLDDIDTTTAAPSTGDLLEWNGTNWVPITFGADDLDDIDTTTAAPSTGDVLEWDGSNWVPATRIIDDLNDVDTTTVAPNSGDFLKWDGSNWTPSAT